MTKLQLITGVVWTELSPEEVRTYLQGGVKAGTIKAYVDENKTQPIILAVHAIEYIYV
ncbi:hypothetical protein D1872_50800 [compost metagenome]